MAWYPTYYALQLNDPVNDTVVMLPSFGIFTDIDKAQGEANGLNKICKEQFHYTVLPVQITAVQEIAHA